jgi:hypothetical protein
MFTDTLTGRGGGQGHEHGHAGQCAEVLCFGGPVIGLAGASVVMDQNTRLARRATNPHARSTSCTSTAADRSGARIRPTWGVCSSPWDERFRYCAGPARTIALATLRSPGSGPTGRDAEDRVRPRRRIRHRSPVRSLVGVRESDDRSDVQPCDNEEQASGRRRADRGKEKPQRERLGHQRRLRGLSAPICTPRANAARRGSECASTSGTYAIRSPRRTSLVSARRR